MTADEERRGKNDDEERRIKINLSFVETRRHTFVATSM